MGGKIIMNQVIYYGILSVTPLILGAILGAYFKIKEKFIGIISALGAGAIIGALSFGLMNESFNLGGFDNAIIGFLVGAALFIIGDFLIIKIGGRGHKRTYRHKTDFSTSWGLIFAAILDGIPEAIALGASLFLSPQIGFLVLVGIILNNLPESTASAYDLKRIGKKPKYILAYWVIISLVLLVSVILGYTIFNSLSADATATLQSIAAGALLAMVAATMMPEAFRESGLGASMAAVVGYLLIFVLSRFGV